MRLGYDLTLEQSQKLVMTPELRQAIQLLQYTSLELNEYLEKQLESNPLLEIESPPDDHENIEEITKENDEIDWKEFVDSYEDFSYTGPRDKKENEVNYDGFVTQSSSLKEHLYLQLGLNFSNGLDKSIGEFIIENIDQNGYMITTIEDICDELNISVEVGEKVLQQIQNFDPVGVGSRTLEECLVIQLKEKKIENEKIYMVVENYLEDVAHNRLNKISKELNIELKEVQDICDFIKKLEPKPGRAFSVESEEVKYIKPDITLQEVDGEYVIILNDITGPRLNINKFYRELISNSDDENATTFLTDKLNSALWIIRSIEQRRMTIYNVVKSILKFQGEFFKKGEKALKPLTLKDVAEDIEVHESTVSRATSGKYIQTPRGLFELKYFFTTGISSNKGDISATSIKAQIKDLIEDEDPKKPYSDQQIANILNAKSIDISRRTIAKYRDEMDIPSSSLRRRY